MDQVKGERRSLLLTLAEGLCRQAVPEGAKESMVKKASSLSLDVLCPSSLAEWMEVPQP